MSILNGSNGHRVTLLHKLFGIGSRSSEDVRASVSATSSDGSLAVDVKKLVNDAAFKKSAKEVEDFFLDLRNGDTEGERPKI